MVFHRNGRLIRRRSITRSRSRGTASWWMTSMIVVRIERHIQIIIVSIRYRHRGAASGRSRWRRTARAKLNRTIIKIRFWLLTLRRHVLVIHRHFSMWIVVTRIVSVLIIVRRLRQFRSRCRLIREVQPNVWPLARSRSFGFIPEHYHGPVVCFHILKTWEELRNCHKENMIMVTWIPENHHCIRMSVNHWQ